MTFQERVNGFAGLGSFLSKAIHLSGQRDTSAIHSKDKNFQLLDAAITQAVAENQWFTREHILFALSTWANELKTEKINRWIEKYDLDNVKNKGPLNIGVVMAGNIPLVGFHDFLCVLMSGHRFSGKLSSEDKVLLPALAGILTDICPGFEEYISFTDNFLTGFDAVIATGSNNSYRYFEFYFGKYPHILRKNRNSIALLDGKESTEQLSCLADDIFLYFGKGCRNVSKIYLPIGYDIENLKMPFQKYSFFQNHNKFRNNYDYHKAVYLMNSTNFHDFSFLLLKEDPLISSPVSIVHYEYYNEIQHVMRTIEDIRDQIQCIVCLPEIYPGSVLPGKTQLAGLKDYADGIDTMNFLISL